MPEEDNCPICGEELIGYKKFCGECGSQVEPEEDAGEESGSDSEFDEAMNKATAAMKSKDLKASLVALDEAIKAKPDSAKAWNNKAVVLAKLGESENAIKSFDRALEISPTVVNLWVGKGTMLLKNQRPGEAKECFEKALELDPNNKVAQEKLAKCQ
jgi:Tfp pilus assembly protein PilF